MSVHLVHPGTIIPIRRLPLSWMLVNVAVITDLEVWAEDEAQTECRLGCSSATGRDVTGWLTVSDDGGNNWHAVPMDVESGYQLGPLTADQRKAIKVKVLIPLATEIREESIGLDLGLGT